MKKAVRLFGIQMFLALFALNFIFLSASWAGTKTIRFVVGSGVSEGGQEVAGEIMAMNMYLGALDYRIRTFHALKGKYELKWITGVFNNMDEALQGVASGAGEIALSGPNYMEQFDPGWKAPNSPGVFESWDHFAKTMNTSAWKDLNEKMAKEKNIRVIKWAASTGTWFLYTSKAQENALTDLKGQKIRYAGGEAFARGLQQLGATPISLPYTEVVTGLQTKMIDGLLTDFFAALYFYNLPRYTQFVVDIPWAISPICFVVNNKWWESLPEKERVAMQDVFDRIDVSQFFENAQKALAGAWEKNPETKIIKLSQADIQSWNESMKKGSDEALKNLDPELLNAIESSR